MDYKNNIFILIIPLFIFIFLLIKKDNNKETFISKSNTNNSNTILISKIINRNLSSTQSFLQNKNIDNILDLVNYSNELTIKEKKRLDGYLKLIKVYLLYDDKILILLNNNIHDIKNLLDNKHYLSPKEIFGLEYYSLGKVPSKYYFELINIINLSPNTSKKDIYDILILFEYYDILNLRNSLSNSDITLQIKLGKNGWMYKILKHIKDNKYNDTILIKYKIIDKVNVIIDKLDIQYKTVDINDLDKTDFSEIEFKSNEDKLKHFREKYHKELYEKEYKTIETLNNISNIELTPKPLDFDILLKEFSDSMINILNELIVLFSGNSNQLENLEIEPYIENSDLIKNSWNKYIYYFRMVGKILFINDRILYFGILLIILSIIMLISNN